MKGAAALAVMSSLVWATGCRAESVKAANDNERTVLQLIRAAEAGRQSEFAGLAAGVQLSDPVYGGSEPLTADRLKNACQLDHLLSHDSFVSASWKCPWIQGVTYSFKFEGGKIVAATHTPEE
ncbi:MAG TPA: hypothetical protein VJM09_01580 [Sphingobium sp.]|nr:hypothetical protein [Sphingobium sp.]